jgi:hypothetical protein
MNQILYRKLHKHTCRNTIRIENFYLQIIVSFLCNCVIIIIIIIIDLITLVSIYLLGILHLFQTFGGIRLSHVKEVHSIPNDQTACPRNLHTTVMLFAPCLKYFWLNLHTLYI